MKRLIIGLALTGLVSVNCVQAGLADYWDVAKNVPSIVQSARAIRAVTPSVKDDLGQLIAEVNQTTVSVKTLLPGLKQTNNPSLVLQTVKDLIGLLMVDVGSAGNFVTKLSDKVLVHVSKDVKGYADIAVSEIETLVKYLQAAESALNSIESRMQNSVSKVKDAAGSILPSVMPSNMTPQALPVAPMDPIMGS